MGISNKALLVNLSISQWVGRRIDRQATNTVEVSHLTDKRVGNYTKKLLPGAKELDNIQRLANALRVFFYQQTLPWCSDGSRIISSKNYLDFTNAFRTKKAEFDRAVAEFLVQYPLLREQARLKLGQLFQENEYPSESYLQNHFSCEVTFMPVPDVSDFRVELTDSEKQTFLESMRKVETAALQDCFQRMHDVVNKAATKLADPSAIFRDSLIQNIQEICTLMPKLNVTDDASLEATRQDIERVVASINPEACREHDQVRSEAARALASITDKMSAFME